MKTKQIDREFLKQLRISINDALEPVAKRYGIELTAENATFSAERCTFKVEGTLHGASDKFTANWKAYAEAAGLDAAALGQSVRLGSKTFTVRGLQNGARSVMLEAPDGRLYRTPIDTFRAQARLLGVHHA